MIPKGTKINLDVVATGGFGIATLPMEIEYNGDPVQFHKGIVVNAATQGYTVHYEIGHDWIVRGNSIAKWLSDNLHGCIGEYQYAIVDDDDDMLMRQAGHFVQTDAYTGITESDVEKLRNILESDII